MLLCIGHIKYIKAGFWRNKMNLPNKLTVLRICLVPFFVFFLLIESIPYRYVFAFVIFAFASYTDHLDGKIARKRNLITNFGKLMDPLADKIMVMAALICFVKLDLAWAWCVIIIMFREFAVTSIRMIAVEQGEVIPANNWGKAKTISQIVAIISILVFQSVISLFSVPEMIETVFLYAGHAMVVIATMLTLISGIIYAKDSASIFKDM